MSRTNELSELINNVDLKITSGLNGVADEQRASVVRGLAILRWVRRQWQAELIRIQAWEELKALAISLIKPRQ